MFIKYLCVSWKALVAQAVNLIGNGYYYYHVTYLPDNKKDKWLKIDRKFLEKYNLVEDNKDKRDYRKNKLKLANFTYLRWENVVIVLRTEGGILSDGKLIKDGEEKVITNEYKPKQIEKHQVIYDDKFSNIHQAPIFLKISDEVLFDIRFMEKTKYEIIKNTDKKGKITYGKGKKISQKNQVTVRLAKSMFKEKKAELNELMQKKAKTGLIFAFTMLNGLPAYRGIIAQKRDLKKFILREAGKHNIKIKDEELPLLSSKTPLEVIFSTEDCFKT